MINNRKKGFTLVELLAVIVILAIILVIAVPKVMSVIEDSKKATLESTAKMIASSAEKQKVQNTVLGNTGAITCDSVAKINDLDYESCNIEFDGNTAKVTIKGRGKFTGLYVCDGTKINAEARNESCETPISALNFEEMFCKDDTTCTANNLLKDEDGNIRYYGENPNNYIKFNNEVWRIVGVFNVASEVGGTKQKRIKIVRNEVLNEEKKYNVSESTTWIGSNLEIYLNGDYYNSLTPIAKGQISHAILNTSGGSGYDRVWSPSQLYALEKLDQKSLSIVGLINVSDFGFAGGPICTNVTDFTNYVCGTANWLLAENGKEYWTISSSTSQYMWTVASKGVAYQESSTSFEYYVLPSVYLNADITITGTGENTTEGIYKIS